MVIFNTDILLGDILLAGCQGRDLYQNFVFVLPRLTPTRHESSLCSFKHLKCRANLQQADVFHSEAFDG